MIFLHVLRHRTFSRSLQLNAKLCVLFFWNRSHSCHQRLQESMSPKMFNNISFTSHSTDEYMGGQRGQETTLRPCIFFFIPLWCLRHLTCLTCAGLRTQRWCHSLRKEEHCTGALEGIFSSPRTTWCTISHACGRFLHLTCPFLVSLLKSTP